jgi:bifunctional non-homologous end joining protein LigD
VARSSPLRVNASRWRCGLTPAAGALKNPRLSACLAFIEHCPPSPADCPPSGRGWVHEIKHFRMMARRDPAGVRLITRNGPDWSGRFPLIAAAAGRLVARSFLIDGGGGGV